MEQKGKAIISALLAAVFYAVNTPVSKLLLEDVPATYMAAFLYLGAGVGVGVMYLLSRKREKLEERLGKKDLLYTVGMIVLDILAPIFLMLGVKYGSASGASLLGNFEIVATTLVALLLFKETVSRRLWLAIGLITAASITLSLDGADGVRLSTGSLFVLLATVCWGFENNCTRSISGKNTYEIVVLKGLFSGAGAFVIAALAGEELPAAKYILPAMLLGFVAYGLSIFLYIRAQRDLGAAKTSAYYAVTPFVGALLSFVMVGERPSWLYGAALVLMAAGTACVVADTLVRAHTHEHAHTFSYTFGGVTCTRTITHSHPHDHYGHDETHKHHHSVKELLGG